MNLLRVAGGFALLLLGMVLETAGVGISLGKTITRSARQDFHEQVLLAEKSGNTAEMTRVNERIEDKVIRDEVGLGIILGIVFIAIGKWVEVEWPATPPMMYLLLTGVFPGFAMYYGWQNIRGAIPANPPPNLRDEDLQNRA